MSEQDKTELDVKPEEQHLLLDHNYDGIHELNHPLPRWWNVIFYVAIIFSIGYFIYYQFMGGPSLRDEFKVSYGKVMEVRAEFTRLNNAFNHEYYEQILANDGVKKGKDVYELNCLPCHADNGKGDIGPNLTDQYWLIAKGTPDTVYSVVFNGSEENGMPIWGEMISKDEIYQAVAYVMTLKNTNVKGGKEPQGEKVEE